MAAATLNNVMHPHSKLIVPVAPCAAGPQVEVLAEYQLRAEEAAAQNGRQSVAVAVRQGPLLATAFHPELTKDLRW